MPKDGMRRFLRCYTESSPGKWQAFCLDFDLAVQGNSFREVYDDLNVAIMDYVERAHGLPKTDRSRLLCRRAPLWERFRSYWKSCIRKHIYSRYNTGAVYMTDTQPYLIKTKTLASEKELAELFSHNLFEDGPLENNIEVCDGIWKREAGIGWYFWEWSDIREEN